MLANANIMNTVKVILLSLIISHIETQNNGPLN